MGNFYTNFTLRGPSQQAVAEALDGRSAIVTPAQDGCVVVYDEQSDEQDQEIISTLAAQLSNDLRCPVLAVLNHDDDMLWYQLHLHGELADEYDSTPDCFEESDAGPEPAGGDAEKLCHAFGVKNVGAVENILRKPASDQGGYLFAIKRHADLARALGLPSFSVGAGNRYVVDGDFPEGLDGDSLMIVT